VLTSTLGRLELDPLLEDLDNSNREVDWGRALVCRESGAHPYAGRGRLGRIRSRRPAPVVEHAL